MTIKITGLELTKQDFPLYKEGSLTEVDDFHIKLEGTLNLKLTQNNISASAYHGLNKISKNAKDKLISALKLIEDELNGVEKEVDIDANKLSYEDVSNGGKIANLHTGEKVLNKNEAEKVIKSSSILEDIMKEVSPLFNNFHETDVDKEVNTVSEALDKAEKVFNVVFNVSEHKTKTAKELVDEIAKAMRTKDMF